MSDESKMDAVEGMMRLAAICHQGQFREGDDAESGRKVPYVVHLMEVTCLLKRWGYTEREYPEVLAIGWGHDLLEDTDVGEDRIRRIAGEKVLAGIRMLTFKPPTGIGDDAYDALKAAYVERIVNGASPEVLAVKMADRLCNVRNRLEDKSNPESLGKAKANFEKAGRLFARAGELPFAARILENVEAMRRKLSEI